MQMFYEDEQVSMFAPDSCAGKMSPAHSPAGSKREMTSGSSWRKHSELVYQEFMFLKITLGDGDILGQPYWEILSPYVGESSTLNTGVCPRVVRGSSLWQILEPHPQRKYYLSRKARLGILRRARKRGKELPATLKLALEMQSGLRMIDLVILAQMGLMMVWSTEPKKGYLTREGIAAMRSRMTNAIFHEEMKELYIKKDAAYKESIQTAKESLLLYIRMLENSELADPVIEQKLWELSHALEQVDGKRVYAYLPKEVKAQVDEIVERLAQLPEVAACYDQWWRLKDEITGYYGRNTPPHQPLVQQKEFRTIKNMIIQQAETFRQPVSEQVPVETEPNEQQVPPSTESPAAMARPQAVALQSAIEVGVVSQLLHHMSRVFRGNMPVIPPALHIDSKRRRRLMEKRMAIGHKRDDHEEAQRQEQMTS